MKNCKEIVSEMLKVDGIPEGATVVILVSFNGDCETHCNIPTPDLSSALATIIKEVTEAFLKLKLKIKESL